LSKLLKTLKGKGSPSSIIYFDTETRATPTDLYEWGEKATLWFGHAVHCRYEHGRETRRDEFTFQDAWAFWRWVSSRAFDKKPAWLMAHNLGFDLTVTRLWELIDRGFLSLMPPQEEGKRFRSGLFVADDPPTIIDIFTKPGQKIIAVDTLNFWRSSLATIGESLGFPKLEMPEFSDYVLTPEWLTYCKNDVYVLAHAVGKLLEFVEENQYGGLTFSAPSLAMRAYRTRFQPCPIGLHQLPSVSHLERLSYYGGRLEAFRIGTFSEKIFKLDVTSLYPSVMKGNLFPKELLDFSTWKQDGWENYPKLTSDMIACVTINTQTDTYPLKTKQGVIFPRGSYVTTLAGPELIHAESRGHIVRVHQWSKYLLHDLFSTFVQHFLDLRASYRLAGDNVNSTFAKLLVNSFYGKWGQLAPQWEVSDEVVLNPLWGNTVDIDVTTGSILHSRYIGNRKEYRQVDGEHEDHPNSFCAIASYVTSYGRERMRSMCECAGWGNVSYLVTDGLFVNEEGYSNLKRNGYVRDKEPGYLTLEQEADDFAITALHQYRIGEKVTRGAIKPRAVQMPQGKWQEVHFEGLKTILAPNPDDLTQAPRDGVCIYPVLKTEPHNYYKGEVTSSGRVLPWNLDTLVYRGTPSLSELGRRVNSLVREYLDRDKQRILLIDDIAALDVDQY
jgi:hypothetical protein